MPTLAEIQKLCDRSNVTSEWISLNGITGRKYTDKVTGNTLFLPAAGFHDSGDDTFYCVGSDGCYWSGTTGPTTPAATGLVFVRSQNNSNCPNLDFCKIYMIAMMNRNLGNLFYLAKIPVQDVLACNRWDARCRDGACPIF